MKDPTKYASVSQSTSHATSLPFTSSSVLLSSTLSPLPFSVPYLKLGRLRNMGNEHHHHHHHHQHQFQHQKLHIHERSTFLPMLCSRPSIRDVGLPRLRDPPASVSGDPLSPRIGCMGQVKRNNKIVGFPTSSRLTFTSKTTTSPAFAKYSKLKKLFSGKNLSTAAADTVTAAAFSGSTTCGRRVQASSNNNRCRKENGGSETVSIDNMDPPLPVIKRVSTKSEEEREVDSLWKRRSGGVALQSLQLQQIHHPRHRLQPTSV